MFLENQGVAVDCSTGLSVAEKTVKSNSVWRRLMALNIWSTGEQWTLSRLPKNNGSQDIVKSDRDFRVFLPFC